MGEGVRLGVPFATREAITSDVLVRLSLYPWRRLEHSMSIPLTNRDLYLAIGALSAQHRCDDRSLEEYLLALHRLTESFRNRDGISLSDFCRLLSDAFTAEPSGFDETWRDAYDTLDIHFPGFSGWQATLICQIVDLREMAENGLLADEYRWGGVSAPRGNQWYNFAPASYIECAATGSVGGWEPGDDTGREFVPGECIVTDASGQICAANPQDIERPVVRIETVSWDLFKDFLGCGQEYE